jgi:hypothetical protein
LTQAEYDRTRKLPERKRATRNGKRSVDAFIKHVRERLIVEQPEHAKMYDEDLSIRLMLLYFYFTKYITARWDIEGMAVCAAAADGENVWYTDNLLNDKPVIRLREMFKDVMREAI